MIKQKVKESLTCIKRYHRGDFFSPTLVCSNFPTQVKDCSITVIQNHNKKLHNQKLERKYNENFWNLQINNFHIIQNYLLMTNKEILFTVPEIQTPLQNFTAKKLVKPRISVHFMSCCDNLTHLSIRGF